MSMEIVLFYYNTKNPKFEILGGKVQEEKEVYGKEDFFLSLQMLK